MNPLRHAFAFSSAAASHVGNVRKLNEDSFVSRDRAGLWAVFDGVGGHDAGDVASRMLAQAFASLELPPGGRGTLEAVEATIQAQNSQMVHYVAETPNVTSMGSTIVLLLAFNDHVACLWAGDSRCYRCRDGALAQVSHDHSLVQELIDAGHITEEEARTHKKRNVITRAVGVSEELALSQVREAAKPGDRYLLCSDGLTGPLTDQVIAQILGSSPDAAEVSDALIDAALKNGARDNVTAIVVDVRSPNGH